MITQKLFFFKSRSQPEKGNSPPFFSQQDHLYPFISIHSLAMQQLFIGTSYVPGIVAGTENTAAWGQALPCSHGSYIPVGMTDKLQETSQVLSDSG